MRAYLPDYELRVPPNLTEALTLLAREPEVWRPFAGGTDLMVLLEAGKLTHKKFFSIRHLHELRGIEETPDHITFGALTTYTEVQSNQILRQEFPMLCRAASETGGLAIQNRGTLGGNIANASPAADSPPALIVYDAQLELVSLQGRRWISYQDFHTGYKQMRMRPDELIGCIRLPRTDDTWKHHYHKVGTRKAQAISKVCFAAMADAQEGYIRSVRVALGSVAPTVIRCRKTEALLKNQKLSGATINAARAELAREIAPIDDLRSTADYRSRVASNILEEFLLGMKSDADH